MKNKLLILCLLCVICIQFVSANGLNLTQSSFTVNKTVGIDEYIIFNITNQEPMNFVNITFEPNKYITMDKVSELNSGATKQLTARIFYNNDANINVRIRGFYLNDLGASNETHIINVNYEGVDICDFTITKGDKVKWINKLNEEIKIVDEFDNTLYSIPKNSSYEELFDLPMVFTYQVLRIIVPISDLCTINVLDDRGYINNPELDASLNLNIVASHEPTTISTNIIQNSYNIDFYETDEGIMSISNTGDKIAKNVKLEGDWFSFSENNFDLNPGETNGIIYSIHPQVFSTEETNKTHYKNITISGNFQTVSQEFEIFINYAQINGQMNNTNGSTLIDYLCSLRPDLCNPQPQIIYKYIGNDTSGAFNVTFYKDRVIEIFEYMFEQDQALANFENIMKEIIYNVLSEVNGTKADITDLKNLTLTNIEKTEGKESDLNWIILIVSSIIIIALLVLLIFFYKRYNKNKLQRF